MDTPNIHTGEDSPAPLLLGLPLPPALAARLEPLAVCYDQATRTFWGHHGEKPTARIRYSGSPATLTIAECTVDSGNVVDLVPCADGGAFLRLVSPHSNDSTLVRVAPGDLEDGAVRSLRGATTTMVVNLSHEEICAFDARAEYLLLTGVRGERNPRTRVWQVYDQQLRLLREECYPQQLIDDEQLFPIITFFRGACEGDFYVRHRTHLIPITFTSLAATVEAARRGGAGDRALLNTGAIGEDRVTPSASFPFELPHGGIISDALCSAVVYPDERTRVTVADPRTNRVFAAWDKPKLKPTSAKKRPSYWVTRSRGFQVSVAAVAPGFVLATQLLDVLSSDEYRSTLLVVHHVPWTRDLHATLLPSELRVVGRVLLGLREWVPGRRGGGAASVVEGAGRTEQTRASTETAGVSRVSGLPSAKRGAASTKTPTSVRDPAAGKKSPSARGRGTPTPSRGGAAGARGARPASASGEKMASPLRGAGSTPKSSAARARPRDRTDATPWAGLPVELVEHVLATLWDGMQAGRTVPRLGDYR